MTAAVTETPPAVCAKTLARARAFNRGCDARLAGTPASACPCRGNDDLAYWWRQGWWDVARFWGADALWAFPDLPEVDL